MIPPTCAHTRVSHVGHGSPGQTSLYFCANCSHLSSCIYISIYDLSIFIYTHIFWLISILACVSAFYSCITNMCALWNRTEKSPQTEEKKLATWGTDVAEDLVLDQKLLAEALKKVNMDHLRLLIM